MEQFLIDLKTITDQNQSRGAAQFLIDNIEIQKVFQKQLGKDFLNKSLQTLQSKSSAPEVKLYTLMIFKFLSASKEKVVTKIYSLLSAHKLLKYLQQLALSVDPRKSLSEKGKTLFPDKKDIGAAFMRLLLQSIKFWGQRFPFNNLKQPTKFKKALLKLTEQKVVMPKQYVYYLGQQSLKQETPNPTTKQQNRQKVQKVQKKKEEVPNTKQDKKRQASQIRFMDNKIQMLVGKIQESQQAQSQQLKQQIMNSHKVFQAEQIKFSEMNIYDNNHSDQIVDKYLKICQFIAFQNQIYKDTIIAADDVYSYCQAILINYDKIFNNQASKRSMKPSLKPSQSRMSKQKVQMQSSAKQKVQTQISQKQVNKSKTIKQTNRTQEPQLNQKLAKKESLNNQVNKQNIEKQSKNKVQTNIKKQVNDDKDLSAFFSRYQSRSKSPQMGFSQIKKSIQKQKKQFKLNPPRGRSPHSSNFGKTVKYGQSVIGSKLHVSGIFAKPPNPLARAANYPGQLVIQNSQLQRCLRQIKRQQGGKKFRISNLKDRYPLFENQHVQIGFKSDPILQKVQNYDSMLEIQMYLGNKTSQKISNLQMYFQSDRNSLVYSNPQVIQSQILPGKQLKHQVIIIPKQIPFSIVNMIITYKYKQEQFHVSCFLPNSFLKFSNYIEVSKRQFKESEEQMTKIFKSQNFRLCHYFPPKKLSHYIPELIQLTQYGNFVQQGSTTDFQLGALVTIQQKYTGALKIIIRPDLTVIISLSVSQTKQEAIRAYKFYIQSLEMVLKEVEV